MTAFGQYMDKYREELQKGVIQKAYKGLMDYIMGLRTHLEKGHPDFLVSNSIYFGYMDMTYFSVIPKLLKQRNLKVAVVFLHEPFRFEVWLAGYNKQVQKKYWTLLRESGWSKYRIPLALKGNDSILEYTLVENPVFDDLDSLTKLIETGTLRFIDDVEIFLSTH